MCPIADVPVRCVHADLCTVSLIYSSALSHRLHKELQPQSRTGERGVTEHYSVYMRDAPGRG